MIRGEDTRTKLYRDTSPNRKQKLPGVNSESLEAMPTKAIEPTILAKKDSTPVVIWLIEVDTLAPTPLQATGYSAYPCTQKPLANTSGPPFSVFRIASILAQYVPLRGALWLFFSVSWRHHSRKGGCSA